MGVESNTGRILIFTGCGKGKTTAALGAALRAAGHQMRVLIIQFIKERSTGEHEALERLHDLIEVRHRGTGFLPENDEEGME
ncbi:MAG: cob(I)yrinic acid a,c-diamide adenosyltransferase, partial [Planctomycetes bacterium]|nr:cob(I)yrinic acid a,c-diamide adenosyltransferase [Planctomycetota bacterium]